MSANPITDQILAAAALTDQRNPPSAAATNVYAEFARAISTSLPGVDPAVIGEVLIHAANHYADLRIAMRSHKPATNAAIRETGFTMGVLTNAGRVLYTSRGETSGT